MADGTRGSSRERVRLLIEAYRRILGRYERIERLAKRERRLLRKRHPLGEVNELLHEKKELLSEIRVEEERVKAAREWWKRSRRSMEPAFGRDLLPLLDTISEAIERTVMLEAECRTLLRAAVARGGGAVATGRSSGVAAAVAYARGAGAVVAGR